MSIMPPEPGSKTVTPRKAISRRLRFEILRRDNHTCRYCYATDTPLTIDHVIPVALGGTDDPSNLVAACKDCNAGKSSSTPDAAMVAQVSEDALRWAAAIKLAAVQASEKQAEARQLADIVRDYWVGLSGMGRSYDLPLDWNQAIASLVAAGAYQDLLLDAADVALSTQWIDNRFRYFMGVANKKLAALQESAQQLIADGAV